MIDDPLGLTSVHRNPIVRPHLQILLALFPAGISHQECNSLNEVGPHIGAQRPAGRLEPVRDL